MRSSLFEKSPISFNITGVIDIVFLLIIFFMVVCQFIDTEHFDVQVPDKVTSANSAEQKAQQTPTITVMLTENGAAYAVGQKVLDSENDNLADAIADAIDARLNQADLMGIVSLRIDKDIRYKQYQYALAGISRSNAAGMELAVIRE